MRCLVSEQSSEGSSEKPDGYLLQGLPCLLHAEMPQEAEDERSVDAKLLLCVLRPHLQHGMTSSCAGVFSTLGSSLADQQEELHPICYAIAGLGMQPSTGNVLLARVV